MSHAASLTDPVAESSFGLVVLNWNNSKDTLECLGHLAECDLKPERVVVVDNASEDDSVQKLRDWWSAAAGSNDPEWLVILTAPSNLGFAGGSNLGIRHLMREAQVSHIVLLNNDTVVPKDFFRELRAALVEANDPGILGPTIREYPATDKIWYAGAREYFFRGLVQHRHELPARNEPQRTDFVTGCAMVISRQVLQSVGDLSEYYFPAYFEDGDLCHRAMRAGFSVMYAPRPVIYHKVGATVRAAGPSLQLAFTKSRLRVVYVRRNYRGLTKAIALTYLAVTKPLRSVVEVLKGEPRYGWQVLRGTVSGFLARGIA